MKNILFLVIGLLLIGCDNTETFESEPALIGSWTLVSQSDKKNPTKIGYSFSSDHQYFNVDSQGQAINRFRPKYWDYHNDTLILVDTNVEPHLLDTKGTKTFFVDQLNDSLLKMSSIGEQYQITYTYKRN
jgi:hypothetical protein